MFTQTGTHVHIKRLRLTWLKYPPQVQIKAPLDNYPLSHPHRLSDKGQSLTEKSCAFCDQEHLSALGFGLYMVSVLTPRFSTVQTVMPNPVRAMPCQSTPIPLLWSGAEVVPNPSQAIQAYSHSPTHMQAQAKHRSHGDLHFQLMWGPWEQGFLPSLDPATIPCTHRGLLYFWSRAPLISRDREGKCHETSSPRTAKCQSPH